MNSVVSIALTSSGRAKAKSLPFDLAESVESISEAVSDNWTSVDGMVLFCATGIAVRSIAPLLAAKKTDPAIVVVDQDTKYAIALSGGHRPGLSANSLAEQVGELLGAQPVITTATDAAAIPALDTLPGFAASGDIATVTRRMLDQETLLLDNPNSWPIPEALESAVTSLDSWTDPSASAHIVVSDTSTAATPGSIVLRPPSLVLGVGASTNAPSEAAADVLDQVLAEHGLARESIATLATIDRRAPDPVVTSLGLDVRSFSSEELAEVEVPNPSDVVMAEVGTASVCEAAALLAAGPGATLIVQKTKGLTATVAIARRARPQGRVFVVGLGPGHAKHRTPQADAAIRHAEVVIGYTFYVEQCRHLTSPHQQIVTSPLGAEVDRCKEAVRRASEGQVVALVCSGDPGIFAMASLVFEVAGEFGHPDIEVVPGVTASLASSAILGAPLGHDHAHVSLSDLLTPWPLIERRLHALAEADMAVAFYNPRSQRRITQLQAAKEIFLDKRPPSTPVGIVVNATRPGERVIVTTLSELDPAEVDMFSLVVFGSSSSYLANGRIVTPRGYNP